jgi:pimeloyl-ACP methyl ester carboxylesterase
MFLADGISGAERAVFEDSAHMAMVEEPDRYRQVIQSWLTRAEASQA